MYQLCRQRSRDDTKFQRIWIQFTASVLWRKSSVIRSNRSSSKIYFTLLYVHPDSLLRLRLFREAFYRSWKRQVCKCNIGEQKPNCYPNLFTDIESWNCSRWKSFTLVPRLIELHFCSKHYKSIKNFIIRSINNLTNISRPSTSFLFQETKHLNEIDLRWFQALNELQFPSKY